MPWPDVYTASDKRPALEKAGHTRLYTDSLCTYTAENLELLDTPVHIHVHVMAMHEYEAIITVLIVSIRQITVLPM